MKLLEERHLIPDAIVRKKNNIDRGYPYKSLCYLMRNNLQTLRLSSIFHFYVDIINTI